MMKAWFVVSIGSLLLLGCTEVKYVKHGATKADLEADTVDCQNQIPMSPIGPTIGSGQMGRPGVREGITSQTADQSVQREIDQCLRAKGWVMETQPSELPRGFMHRQAVVMKNPSCQNFHV